MHVGQSDLRIMQEKTTRRCWQQRPSHNGEFWVGVGATKGTRLQTTAWLLPVPPACQPSFGGSYMPGIPALLFQRLRGRIWESDCQPPVQLVGYALHSVLNLNLVYIFSNPFLVLNRSLINKMIRTTTSHRVLTVKSYTILKTFCDLFHIILASNFYQGYYPSFIEEGIEF